MTLLALISCVRLSRERTAECTIFRTKRCPESGEPEEVYDFFLQEDVRDIFLGPTRKYVYCLELVNWGDRMGSADLYVTILIIIVVAVWALYHFQKWLYEPYRNKLPFELEDVQLPEPSEETALLEAAGYEIMSGKRKISLSIEADGQSLHSALWVDYFVRKDDEVYAVKTARRRRPVDWTGSGLRDYFLPYALIYDQLDGVLYIEPEHKTIHKICFHIRN